MQIHHSTSAAVYSLRGLAEAAFGLFEAYKLICNELGRYALPSCDTVRRQDMHRASVRNSHIALNRVSVEQRDLQVGTSKVAAASNLTVYHMQISENVFIQALNSRPTRREHLRSITALKCSHYHGMLLDTHCLVVLNGPSTRQVQFRSVYKIHRLLALFIQMQD